MGGALSNRHYSFTLVFLSVIGLQSAHADSDRERLLEAVGRDLNDHVAKLVYADFLSENGDSQGDYLRLAVELVHPSPPSKARKKVILAEMQALEKRDLAKWVPFPPKPGEIDYIFRDGVIHAIHVSEAFFSAHHDEIFAKIPTLQFILPFGVDPSPGIYTDPNKRTSLLVRMNRFLGATHLWIYADQAIVNGDVGGLNVLVHGHTGAAATGRVRETLGILLYGGKGGYVRGPTGPLSDRQKLMVSLLGRHWEEQAQQGENVHVYPGEIERYAQVKMDLRERSTLVAGELWRYFKAYLEQGSPRDPPPPLDAGTDWDERMIREYVIAGHRVARHTDTLAFHLAIEPSPIPTRELADAYLRSKELPIAKILLRLLKREDRRAELYEIAVSESNAMLVRRLSADVLGLEELPKTVPPQPNPPKEPDCPGFLQRLLGRLF